MFIVLCENRTIYSESYTHVAQKVFGPFNLITQARRYRDSRPIRMLYDDVAVLEIEPIE
jgi:hypothetical protein